MFSLNMLLSNSRLENVTNESDDYNYVW